MVDVVLLIKLLTIQSSTDLLLAIFATTTLLIFSFRLEGITKSNPSKDERQLELSDLSTRIEKAENDLTAAKAQLEANGCSIDDLRARLKKAESDLIEAQAKIGVNEGKLDNLFLLSMGSDIYTSLKKIVSGHFGKYHKKPNGILDRELRYLRVIGYIEVKDNVIGRIPERGENLSEYVWATEIGKEFVTLRESIEQQKPN